jgi:hypothetical protein
MLQVYQQWSHNMLPTLACAGAQRQAAGPPGDAVSHALQGYPRDWPHLSCLAWAQAALGWQQVARHLVDPSHAAPMGRQILKVTTGPDVATTWYLALPAATLLVIQSADIPSRS